MKSLVICDQSKNAEGIFLTFYLKKQKVANDKEVFSIISGNFGLSDLVLLYAAPLHYSTSA